MIKQIRPARRRKQTSTACDIQQLETKQLLTGTVEVSFSDQGDVHVNGDGNDNDVTITINGRIATVTGNNGTSLKSGNRTVNAGTPVNVRLPTSVRDLDVDMKGGDDTIEVIINSNIRINGDIDVETGSGDDTVYVAVNGAFAIVGGSVSIETGSGDDAIAITDFEKFADVDTPAEFRAVENDTNRAGQQQIRIGKDLDIKTGPGVDSVAVMGVEVRRDVEIKTGLGQEDVVALTNVRANRDVEIHAADYVALNNIYAGLELEVFTRAGEDAVVMEDVSANEIEVELGTGDDRLAIGQRVVARSHAEFDGGLGYDNIVRQSSLSGAEIDDFDGNSVNANGILYAIFNRMAETGLF